MIDETDELIDRSQWVKWTKDEPLITPERRAKGDISFEVDCRSCAGSGKEHGEFCRPCMGRGRIADHRPADEAISDIRYAQVHVRNIMNYLWECDILDDQQHHDGQTFQIWREMHQASMGLRRPVSSGTEEKTGVRLRAYGYVLLLKRLHSSDHQAIDRAIETFSTDHTRFFALRFRQAYTRAFGNLSRMLPPIKDQIAYLEGLSEEERNALSEERLKKIIDGLVKCG